MPTFSFSTVDVFTDRRFGGNPLAVVLDADALTTETMQKVAAEFNLSETTFVRTPTDPGHTAAVRIFNRSAEMAFAGHPMVGTAFILARADPDLSAAVFEVPAGLVRVEVDRAPDGSPTGATITTPQPLRLGDRLDAATAARMIQVASDDIVIAHHLPVIASNGNPYLLVEVRDDALARCTPDLAAFREVLGANPQLGNRLSAHVYVRNGGTLRARMFAPLSGTWEDSATGSANAPLACLLLSLDGGDEATFVIHQGTEMGRPSTLDVTARREPGGIIATVRGSCVPIMRGEIDCD